MPVTINLIREKITILKRLATEHEEYLPEEERFERYRLDLDTASSDLRNKEVDEAQAAIFTSNLNAEHDVLGELNFHSRKIFEALTLDSIEVNSIGLEQNEIKLLKILELILEGDTICKSIDHFRENSLDDLPASINNQVVVVNQKFISNIDLIFSDPSDKNHILDSIKEMDDEMAFFTLHGFYQSQVLKFLKDKPLII